jgi:hypothetical protein
MGRCAGTAVDGGISWRTGPDDAVGIVDKPNAARFVRARLKARFAFSLRFACVRDAV